MDIRFQPNNTHLENAKTFHKTDPHLKRLYQQKYVYRSPLIDRLPRTEPGIVTLGGGRQIGKSTLLKQWMEDLLKQGTQAEAICFFSGELVGDHQSLCGLIQAQLKEMPTLEMKYFIIDGVTYIEQWDKTINYLADISAFEQVVVVLSGSDLVLIQDARKRFPGRRGRAEEVDFHYYPLSFRQFLQLKNNLPAQKQLEDPLAHDVINMLFSEFEHYLIHGGFLTAINGYAMHDQISTSTLNTYSDWIRGDMLKRSKNEFYLREIIGAVIKHYGKQIAWDNLVKELSIDHTQTVADYINLLQSMDAVFVQAALIEDKLGPAPKKRKKVIFNDPFIYHAMRAWLESPKDPYQDQILATFDNPERYAELVEACVTSHFRRFFPTYYIKAEGEVDVAYIHKKRFWPVEVKWSKQLRPSDLKQICKYKNGEIYAKTTQFGTFNDLLVKPLPVALSHVDMIDL